MSKFNLRLLLAIIVGIVKVIVEVLSEGASAPSDGSDVNNLGCA